MGEAITELESIVKARMSKEGNRLDDICNKVESIDVEEGFYSEGENVGYSAYIETDHFIKFIKVFYGIKYSQLMIFTVPGTFMQLS